MKIPWRKLIVAGAYLAGGWLVRHGWASKELIHWASAAAAAILAWIAHNPPPIDRAAELKAFAERLETLEKKLSQAGPAPKAPETSIPKK